MKKTEYMNPEVVGINRLAPRAYYFPYSDKEKALSYTRRNSDRYYSLNGVWDILYFDSPRLITDNVMEELFSHDEHCDCENHPLWEKINVPSVVERENSGYKPYYTNVDYPFPVDPPNVPSDNPTYLYRRFFEIPENYNEKVFLRFEGVDSAYYVYVNNSFVGFSKGSRLPGEFDITPYVSFGENTLVVKVLKWSDASYIEDQDMWYESGIFRDVYLLFRPNTYIYDTKIDTVFDKNYKNATLNLDFEVVNPQKGQKILAELFDSDENLVKSKTIKATQKTLSIPVTAPNKWTAETPYLYKVIISLIEEDKVLEVIPQRVGFRQIELKKYYKDGEHTNILLNGKPIIFRGTNRHEHHPKTGRALTDEMLLEDVLLIKGMNLNAVRTSHYCNDPRWLDLCDEYGLYLIDECDLETHAVGEFINKLLTPGQSALVPTPVNIAQSYDRESPEFQKIMKELIFSDNSKWTKAYVDRMERMCHRDKNRASVIIWSLGNESQFGKNHKAMYKVSKEICPKPVHYEGDYKNVLGDMLSRMYPTHKDLEKIGSGDDTFDTVNEPWNPKGPVNFKKTPMIMCEFVHAMGCGPGAVEEYIELIYKYPRLQGGFIWQWHDHGMEEWTQEGEKYYAYGGDYGENPHDGNFFIDGMMFPDRQPSPGALEYKKATEPVKMWLKGYSPFGLREGKSIDISPDEITKIPSINELKKAVFEIENRFDFSDLSHLNFNYIIEEDGKNIKSGFIPTPKISPREVKTFAFDMPKINFKKDKNYYIKFAFSLKEDTPWAKAGEIVAWEQFLVKEAQKPIFESANHNIEVFEDEEFIYVSGCDFSVEFSKYEGALSGWNIRGKEILSEPIKADFWRPQIDNDCVIIKHYDFRKAYKMDIMSHRVKSCKVAFENGLVNVIIESRVACPTISFGYDVKYNYEINSKGEIKLTFSGTPWGYMVPDHIMKIGLTGKMLSDMEYAKWFGRGPHETYCDSKNFCPMGLYRGNVDDFYTPYVYPQEHGAKSDTKWAEVYNIHRQGFRVEALDRIMFSISRFDTETIEKATHPFELERTDGIVLHLDLAQHGLGTAACGPGVLDKYSLKPQAFEYSVIFKPL